MKKIKVRLIHEGQSSGRGVGFYGQSLQSALEKAPEIELVDKHPDITHYTYFNLFSPDLPVIYTNKTVITIHDLTPLVLPKLYPLGLKSSLGKVYQQWRAINASAIITDSINSMTDIKDFFNVESHKIFVTPLASRELFYSDASKVSLTSVKQKFSLPEHFVLTVAGGANPNKNLVKLANACNSIGIKLVIVGKGVGMDPKTISPHPELNDFFELVKMKNVMRLGFVSDEELLALYKLTDVYCQASLYEGFGLPLLEAMAAQTLIVSSNKSSLPEIYDQITPNFDPADEQEMSQVLKEAISLSAASKDKIVLKNYQRSKEFSFEKMASRTITAYKYSLAK